ncbi:MAG TPA: dimethylamine monooxygenase subunit DmmA family protein [Nevskiales bacterium]|nr:dimethylamine monooxygenase subunit DmmA family protein [Nevskiales bacterium]
MLVTGIKSQPVYAELMPDPRGTRHLLLAEGDGGAALLRLYASFHAECQPGEPCLPSREIHYLRAPAPAIDHSAALRRLEADAVALYDNLDDFRAALRNLLDEACMGLRLYVAGREGFLWTVSTLASEFGVYKDEIQRELVGTRARPVYCVHCKTLNHDVTTNIARCTGCGVMLLVRDHFSRRLGAYMGVCVDAEMPGEIPPIEEVFR